MNFLKPVFFFAWNTQNFALFRRKFTHFLLLLRWCINIYKDKLLPNGGRKITIAVDRNNDFIMISYPCTHHFYWLLQPPSSLLWWPAWNVFVTITILIRTLALVLASEEIFIKSLIWILYIIHCFFYTSYIIYYLFLALYTYNISIYNQVI